MAEEIHDNLDASADAPASPKGAPLQERVRRSAARLYAGAAYVSGLTRVQEGIQWLCSGPRLLILVYHRVNDDPSDQSPFTVTPRQFDAHMRTLAARFRVVSLTEAMRLAGTNYSGKDVAAVTLDDGYRDNCTIAAPLLAERSIPATFFICTGLVEGEAGSGGQFRHPGMSWDQVTSLHRAGFGIGAHTCSHETLTTLPPGVAGTDISRSKDILEDKLGAAVPAFAYPGGKRGRHYNDGLERVVAEKFQLCCTTDRGRNNLSRLEPLRLRRICVRRWWSIFHFERELEGAFDLAAGL